MAREGAGKIGKHSAGDGGALADDPEDLLHTALSLARDYHAEHALDRLIARLALLTQAQPSTPAAGGSEAGLR